MVAGSALEPLTEHDRLRGTHLLTTLEVFLTHNAQAVPAAAALGVHRHTLRNRIRKVTELTGRNLDSPHDRTELWLALKAREIAQLGPQLAGRGDQPADR
jgi:purine catabolism regulator